MTLPMCSRQREVSELLSRGHWPHACPPELRAHLADCRSCSELLLVMQAFQQSRNRAIGEVQLPGAGAIWWRAQLRRRNAAIERVSKPILGAYVFALLFTLVAAAVFAVTQAKHGLHWLDWLSQAGSATEHIDSFVSSSWSGTGGTLAVLIPVMATVALVGALLVYFSEQRQK